MHTGKFSIRTKILLVSMLSTIIGILSVSLALILIDISLLQSTRNASLHSQLEIIAKNLSSSLVFQDQDSAQEVLNSLSLDSTILHVSVKDSNNENFANYSLSTTLQTSVPIVFGWINIPEQEIFEKDIFAHKEKVGVLQVTLSNIKLSSHITQLMIYCTYVLIVVTFFTFLTSLWMQRSISGPIRKLSHLSNNITAQNNYTLRTDINGTDEIAQLANDFDKMLDQIENRDIMLEKKVMLRTAEIEVLAEDFRHRAFHDTLTGLPNRALLTERFLLAISHAKRNQSQFALLLLDLDNFKNINDSLGHDFGDELLKSVASRITHTVRAEDLVCRLGGDEFIVLIENVNSPSDVKRASTNITIALNKQATILNKRIEITTSIGGSIYPVHGSDLTTLKRSADIAMYNAKDTGRNQYKLFEPQMEAKTLHRLMVQNELRMAISTGQIRPYFQPKINAQTKLISGCEVLVRWQHPKDGLIFPDNFIPIAEEAGLIRLIDYYVLDQACQQAKKWLDGGIGAIPVAINLSGAHFRDDNIVGIIKIALTSNGLPPELLEIELTEAVLISDPDKALSTLQAISDLGVKISLDDFGVGYSSLYYLRKLPVDIIKIDRSFVSSVNTNLQDQRLVKGIVSLAQGLGLDVVAEGVETQEQESFLSHAGCHYLQGYYYLKPQPIHEFEQWVINSKRIPA